jgi:hypothetical protein
MNARTEDVMGQVKEGRGSRKNGKMVGYMRKGEATERRGQNMVVIMITLQLTDKLMECGENIIALEATALKNVTMVTD